MAQIIADGGCLCGAVRYSVKGEVLWTCFCHCESCRRQTSSPVTAFFCIREQDMMFHGENLAFYESSPGVERGFCNKCGTPMSYAHKDRPGEIDLYAMTLDDPSKFEAQKHSFWNERVNWLNIEDGLEKNEGDA